VGIGFSGHVVASKGRWAMPRNLGVDTGRLHSNQPCRFVKSPTLGQRVSGRAPIRRPAC